MNLHLPSNGFVDVCFSSKKWEKKSRIKKKVDVEASTFFYVKCEGVFIGVIVSYFDIVKAYWRNSIILREY